MPSARLTGTKHDIWRSLRKTDITDSCLSYKNDETSITELHSSLPKQNYQKLLLRNALGFQSVSRVIIFRRICNMQEKLFIQYGRFSFFFRPKLQTLFSQK